MNFPAFLRIIVSFHLAGREIRVLPARALPELAIDGLRNGLCHALAPPRCPHRRLIFNVGKIAQFDQHRRNIRCLEDAESRKSVGPVRQATNLVQLRDEYLRELRGAVLGFALGQVDQGTSTYGRRGAGREVRSSKV